MSTINSENLQNSQGEQYKVTVEIEEFLLIKDAFSRAIDELNSSQNEIKLKNEPSKYVLRLAKKSGKPNIELPPILMENCVKLMNNVERIRISVVFNENHFVTKLRESVTGIGTDENLFCNSKKHPKGASAMKSFKCCCCCIIY
jgi:hypothetical protein